MIRHTEESLQKVLGIPQKKPSPAKAKDGHFIWINFDCVAKAKAYIATNTGIGIKYIGLETLGDGRFSVQFFAPAGKTLGYAP